MTASRIRGKTLELFLLACRRRSATYCRGRAPFLAAKPEHLRRLRHKTCCRTVSFGSLQTRRVGRGFWITKALQARRGKEPGGSSGGRKLVMHVGKAAPAATAFSKQGRPSLQQTISQATVASSREPTAFLLDVVQGFRRKPKRLPSKYLYDEVGSHLFGKICMLPEYYLARTELAIMRQNGAAMGRELGRGVLLTEYGSGNSTKTRWLLDHLSAPACYVPVDISREYLQVSAARLARAYRHIEILPVCADFTEPFLLPEPCREPSRKVVYFPGSTIGNFEPAEVARLLGQIGELCGVGGGLLIGVDLKKDAAIIEAAYNDAQGVTAQFNLNFLRRINRELGANFRTEEFRHRAVYNAQEGRVELGLVSGCRQTVRIEDQWFRFECGEEIRTEYSYKYTIDQFGEMAASAGFTLQNEWSDAARKFAVLYFVRST
jgi:dimethylhistidine N-methyltransferase